jgi:hypothetical protein
MTSSLPVDLTRHNAILPAFTCALRTALQGKEPHGAAGTLDLPVIELAVPSDPTLSSLFNQP